MTVGSALRRLDIQREIASKRHELNQIIEALQVFEARFEAANADHGALVARKRAVEGELAELIINDPWSVDYGPMGGGSNPADKGPRMPYEMAAVMAQQKAYVREEEDLLPRRNAYERWVQDGYTCRRRTEAELAGLEAELFSLERVLGED